MLPGGREALKRSVGGFAGAGRVVRTCYRVGKLFFSYSFAYKPTRFLHVAGELSGGAGGAEGRMDGWGNGDRGQKAPFEAAFSNLSGSESAQNPVST